jgi:Cysteine-rich secretory protein family
MKCLSYFIKQLFSTMTTKFMLLLLLSASGQYVAAQSRTPSKPNQVATKSKVNNLTKKAPIIDAKAPKMGETLAVLEDFPSVQLPATPSRQVPKAYSQPTTTQTSNTSNNGKGMTTTTNVRTTTQRNPNGSSTMTVTTYNVKKSYEPNRAQQVKKTVIVPNTPTVYASTTPVPTTVRVKNNTVLPKNNTAPTTVRTAIHSPNTTSTASAFSELQRSAANTGVYANYLSAEEKKVLQLINLARTDGSLFLKEYADKYIAANPVFKNNKFAQSLYVDLRKAKALPALTPNEKLFRSAKAHATDIGSKGLKGHNSSSGESFNKRIPKFLSSYLGYGENISYGHDNNNALAVVMLLLIDNNNPDYGHRKNILSPSFESIGASIQQHKTYGYLCVQDFGTAVQ